MKQSLLRSAATDSRISRGVGPAGLGPGLRSTGSALGPERRGHSRHQGTRSIQLAQQRVDLLTRQPNRQPDPNLSPGKSNSPPLLPKHFAEKKHQRIERPTLAARYQRMVISKVLFSRSGNFALS